MSLAVPRYIVCLILTYCGLSIPYGAMNLNLSNNSELYLKTYLIWSICDNNVTLFLAITVNIDKEARKHQFLSSGQSHNEFMQWIYGLSDEPLLQQMHRKRHSVMGERTNGQGGTHFPILPPLYTNGTFVTCA